MALKKCNCDECLGYEERLKRLKDQPKKESSQKFYSRKPTTRSTLQQATPSESLHTDFNIEHLPCSPHQNLQERAPRPQDLHSTTSPNATNGSMFSKAGSSTERKSDPSVDYDPDRDYNPDSCDCYDCINAMHAVGRGKTSKQKRYTLKDPPTEGHNPIPPRQRGRISYSWVKQLDKMQQPGKSNKSSRRMPAQKSTLEEDQQRLPSGKTQQLAEKREEFSFSSLSMDVPVNKNHISASSIMRNEASKSSSNQVSQGSRSSFSSHTGQSGGSTFRITERSGTRTLGSTGNLGTLTTTCTLTSTSASTMPASLTSAATTSQGTTRTEKSEKLTNDYASRNSSARDGKK
ncbi:hypothetical protein KIN20_019138 [Parelaphostrongylus tenuis]|uniref:Uncharacterized protein n=1 Tax=Parelaphostrongylus tenuis TaxID=148309 RepID=A0AAD5N1W0_PARTN|nr:hypothetical protein KIN20_019138 [Parelaphostrongylus tenuis]